MNTENEVLITAIFVGFGLLAYLIIPGLLVMGDRVSDPNGGRFRRGSGP